MSTFEGEIGGGMVASWPVEAGFAAGSSRVGVKLLLGGDERGRVGVSDGHVAAVLEGEMQ